MKGEMEITSTWPFLQRDGLSMELCLEGPLNETIRAFKGHKS